jgi:hypothetical protein
MFINNIKKYIPPIFSFFYNTYLSNEQKKPASASSVDLESKKKK